MVLIYHSVVKQLSYIACNCETTLSPNLTTMYMPCRFIQSWWTVVQTIEMQQITENTTLDWAGQQRLASITRRVKGGMSRVAKRKTTDRLFRSNIESFNLFCVNSFFFWCLVVSFIHNMAKNGICNARKAVSRSPALVPNKHKVHALKMSLGWKQTPDNTCTCTQTWNHSVLTLLRGEVCKIHDEKAGQCSSFAVCSCTGSAPPATCDAPNPPSSTIYAYSQPDYSPAERKTQASQQHFAAEKQVWSCVHKSECTKASGLGCKLPCSRLRKRKQTAHSSHQWVSSRTLHNC